MRKMLVIDISRYTMTEVNFAEPLIIREKMYLKAEGNDNKDWNGLVIAAYVYSPDQKEKLEALLARLQEAEKTYRGVQGEILYGELPKLRTWDSKNY